MRSVNDSGYLGDRAVVSVTSCQWRTSVPLLAKPHDLRWQLTTDNCSLHCVLGRPASQSLDPLGDRGMRLE